MHKYVFSNRGKQVCRGGFRGAEDIFRPQDLETSKNIRICWGRFERQGLFEFAGIIQKY